MFIQYLHLLYTYTIHNIQYIYKHLYLYEYTIQASTWINKCLYNTYIHATSIQHTIHNTSTNTHKCLQRYINVCKHATYHTLHGHNTNIYTAQTFTHPCKHKYKYIHPYYNHTTYNIFIYLYFYP